MAAPRLLPCQGVDVSALLSGFRFHDELVTPIDWGHRFMKLDLMSTVFAVNVCTSTAGDVRMLSGACGSTYRRGDVSGKCVKCSEFSSKLTEGVVRRTWNCSVAVALSRMSTLLPLDKYKRR